MTKPNPFISNEPLNPRLHHAVLGRQNVIDDLCSRILAGEFCLLLGPKYSGRSTLLRAVELHLRGIEGELPLILRPTHLDVTGNARFFSSLAAYVERGLQDLNVRREGKSAASYKTSEYPDAFNLFLNQLLPDLPGRLVLLFDSIERIPPNILIRLAHIGHAIFSERASKPFLRNISFNFAGAISLRYLTFSTRPELSPFNICSDIVVRDLSSVEARDFLERINETLQLNFRYDALSAIVEFAGGDLNMLQKIASLSFVAAGDSAEIDRATVEKAALSLTSQEHGKVDESLRYVGMQVEEDLPTLDLVLGMLQHGSCDYIPSSPDAALYHSFQITYAELAGALILERPDGTPSNWVFRNKLTQMFLQQHFTCSRIVKTYIALGQFEPAVRQCDLLLDVVRQEFEGNLLTFDDNNLKDVLIAYTNRIYAEGSHEFAYKFLATLLERGFGCPVAMYFDYVPTEKKLKAVEFLAHIFKKNDGNEYQIEQSDCADVLEVRVFHSRLFGIEAGKGDELRIAIPLKNISGNVTGILTIFAKSQMSRWTHLNLRIQIMERALTTINVALSKVEIDSKTDIIDSLRLLHKEKKAAKTKLFVAHRFNLELLSNLREHLGRVNSFFEFQYADQNEGGGLLLSHIEALIKSASLCLFEMTSPNNNVYFELGMCMGLNVPGFMFVRTAKDSSTRIPAALEGVSRFEYPDYKGVLERITRAIEDALKRALLNRSEPDYLHFFAVKMPSGRKKEKYIAVFDHDHFGDRRDYRTIIEEIAQEHGLKVAYPLDAGTSLESYVAAAKAGPGVRNRLVNAYALVRYADAVVGRIEKIENDMDASQAFIGLGMAHSCNQKLILTMLQQYEERVLEIPADLRGLEMLQYPSLSDLKRQLRAAFAF
ncbi:MAG TPA: hypothetical protein VHQ22_12415 [Terriglobales bacterium]|jgi:energy-coupling factor transporter ATP-binding protein EcfA2|nr:hypothetical protein [Terriglobales bacterium]